jgi:translation initiation factor IF-2
VNGLSKTRVYELAKELDITSRELIDILLSEFSIKVKPYERVR